MGEKKKKKEKKEKKDKEKKEKKEKATVRSAPDGSDNKNKIHFDKCIDYIFMKCPWTELSCRSILWPHQLKVPLAVVLAEH